MECFCDCHEFGIIENGMIRCNDCKCGDEW